MFGIFDIYFLEAIIDGLLLGGVFALLALGLNLVFGVIDVVWICYGELVMFGIDFHNLGIRLPVLGVWGMYVSYARLLAFGAALAGMLGLYMFLARSYTGAAIRAIAQDRQIMPLMGVDTRKIYIVTSLIGGALAGLAACLLVLQYDVQPFVGLTFAPITFLICVLGGLGNVFGGFVAAFLFAEIISVSGLYLDQEWGYVFAFALFVVLMFLRPQGLLARRS